MKRLLIIEAHDGMFLFSATYLLKKAREQEDIEAHLLTVFDAYNYPQNDQLPWRYGIDDHHRLGVGIYGWDTINWKLVRKLKHNWRAIGEYALWEIPEKDRQRIEDAYEEMDEKYDEVWAPVGFMRFSNVITGFLAETTFRNARLFHYADFPHITLSRDAQEIFKNLPHNEVMTVNVDDDGYVTRKAKKQYRINIPRFTLIKKRAVPEQLIEII